MQVPKEIKQLAQKVIQSGGQAFVVGGAVRDHFMGIQPVDFDVVLVGLRKDVALPIMGWPQQVVGSAPVFMWGHHEVALARREVQTGEGKHGFDFEVGPHVSLQDDLLRRDFTINAMARPVLGGGLVDPFGGLADLRAGILRHVSPHFIESPERVLRLASFAARFDFKVAPETIAICRGMIDDFALIPKEQIWRHFEKMCEKAVKPSRWLDVLVDTGWIRHFPELFAMVGVEQDEAYHPEGTVLIHTPHVMDAAAEIADREGIDRVFAITAALLHDVGKPACTFVADGRIVSPEHAEAGMPIAAQFLDSIVAPHKLRDKVVKAVGLHMRHIGLEHPSKRAVRRFARDLGADLSFAELACLVEADHSGRPPLPKGLPQAMTDILAVAAEIDVVSGFKPLPVGRHLIAMGMTPSPKFGVIQRAAEEAQIAGEFTDEAGLVEWLQDHVD